MITFRFALLIGSILCSARPCAAADHLFTVGLLPNKSGTRDVTLYSIDVTDHKLVNLLTLVSNPEFVLVDLERFVIAAPAPVGNPMQVTIFDTHSQNRTREVRLSYPQIDSPYAVVEVEPSHDELYLSFALGHSVQPAGLAPEATLLGVPLTGESSATEPLSFSALAHPRVTGLIGDQFPENSKLVPEVQGNPLRLAFYPEPGGTLNIPGPPVQTDYYLAVNNDELAVLLPFEESRNSLFQVFDKQKRSWSTLHTPFPSLFVRPFGSWLAFIGSDPAEGTRVPFPPGATHSFRVLPGGYQAGSAEERKKHTVYWHSSVEDQMLTSGHNHSGKLFVINLNPEVRRREVDARV